VHRRWQWATLGGLLALLVVIGYFGAADRQPRPVAAVKLPTLTDEARAGHHWRFGDMLPVPAARADDLRVIVQYVRELQRANGID